MNENASENAGVSVEVARFSVSADHPALPGHFPGRPIVPAVVLLNCLLDCAEKHFGGTAYAAAVIEQAKFLTPLSPTEEVTATLTLEHGDPHLNRLRFRVMRGDIAIAQGSFLLADTGKS